MWLEQFTQFLGAPKKFLQALQHNQLAEPMTGLFHLLEATMFGSRPSLTHSLALYNLRMAQLHRKLHDEIVQSPTRRHRKTSSMAPFELPS